MTAALRDVGLRPWVAASLLFFAFFALYMLTLSNNYSADGMAFVTMTTKGPAGSSLFFQAEHLLYPVAPWLWYKAWSLLGYADGPLRPLQTLNALAGAGGVALLFLSLRTVLRDKAAAVPVSLLGAVSLGFSYGYWYHSTEAEDQIIALAFSTASLMMVVAMAEGRANARRVAGLVVTASLAALFHGTAVLFLPALFLGLERWRHRLGFFAGMGLVLGFSYLAVGAAILGFRSPADFWGWASSAPAKGVWGRLQLGNLTQGARTLSTSVLYSGGFPNLVGSDAEPPLAPFSRIITLVLLAAMLLLVGYGIYRWRRDKWARIALVWLAAVAAFNLYWAPGDIQFWIAAAIPLSMLGAVVWCDLMGRYPARPAWLGVAIIAVAVLFSGNLLGAMAPRSELSTNRGYAQTLCLRDRTSEADLIVTPGWDWASSYLPYFAQREVLSLIDLYLLEAKGDTERFSGVLQQRLSEAWDRGGKVFGVRLFPPDEKARAWFIESAGFDPSNVGLKGKPAGQCLEEPVWEIQP